MEKVSEHKLEGMEGVEKEIATIINRNSLEGVLGDVPDFIAARFVGNCLKALAQLTHEKRVFDGPTPKWPKGVMAISVISPCAVPDDIRAKGWTVSIHNDYHQDGKAMTFWLFTHQTPNAPSGALALVSVKGEGANDMEALNSIREQLGLPLPIGVL